MSIWKSPVFYFGVLLVLAVAVALAAPFLVNWNSYKTDLEAYGRKLTGRDVTIAGPIDVRLFPWPRLTATNVIIANQQGFGDAPLLAADSVTARFSLAGLASASLQVEEVEVDAPQLNLVRSATGEMNWSLTPDASLAGLLSRVKLDRITINDGGVWLEDKLRQSSASLGSISATVSAQAIEGPWRLIGSGQWRDTPLALSVTTGAYKKGDGLKIGFSATPADIALPVLGIDGTWKDKVIEGEAWLQPQEAGEGKGSAEGSLRPLTLRTNYRMEGTRLDLPRITIRPADKKDQGTLVEGEAHMELTAAPQATVSLSSPRINLDTVLGASSMESWRSGGMLALANTVFSELPEGAVVDYSLAVNVLTAGGQAINDVSLEGTAERAAIRIKKAQADVPGRSKMAFDGIVFPAAGAAELGGKLALEGQDLRAFTSWLLPRAASSIATYWQGRRGRYALASTISWSQQRFTMKDTTLDLDGVAMAAGGSWRFGEVPQLDLSLSTADLRLDDYLAKDGRSQGAVSALSTVTALPGLLDAGQHLEHHLKLAADRLSFNGEQLSGLELDYAAGLSGVELKTLKLGTPDSARVSAEGLVINGVDGPLGEFTVKLQAGEAGQLLSLAGLPLSGPATPASKLAGPVTSEMTIDIQPGDKNPVISATAKGTAGSFIFDGKGEWRAEASNAAIFAGGNATVAMTDGNLLLREFGLQPLSGDAAMSFVGKATPLDNGTLNVDVALKGVGTMLQFTGTADPRKPLAALDGKLNTSVQSAKLLLKVLGAPVLPEGETPVSWQGTVKPDAGKLSFIQDQATVDAQPFTLLAELSGDRRLSADLDTQDLTLQQVLRAVLLPWKGMAASLNDGFDLPRSPFASLQVFLRPRVLATGLDEPVKEAVIGIELSGDSRAITVKTPGKTLDFDLSVKPHGASFEGEGKGRVAIDLGKALAMAEGPPPATGTMIVEASFKGLGRSPAALLQSLDGKGFYWLQDASLGRVTADGFAAALGKAATPEQLSATLEALLSPPGTAIPMQTGSITSTGGRVVLAPLMVKTGSEEVDLEPEFDAAAGTALLKLTVKAVPRPDLPPVTVVFEGPVGQLSERRGTAALAAKLGYELLSQEMAKLEALQQQQQALLQKEEAQRLEDEQRFAAYQAQRAELRLRVREQRFFQAERERRAEESRLALEAALKSGDAINKAELSRRLRELAMQRKLAETFVQP